MGTFSIWHWLVVLAVIVLVFGTKKLRNLGGDLGAAVRGFKQGIRDDDPGVLETASRDDNVDESIAAKKAEESADAKRQ